MKCVVESLVLLAAVLPSIVARAAIAQQAGTGFHVLQTVRKDLVTSMQTPDTLALPPTPRLAHSTPRMIARFVRYCASPMARHWTSASFSPPPRRSRSRAATAQDAFCANTYCWMSMIHDQSPKHNGLTQALAAGAVLSAVFGHRVNIVTLKLPQRRRAWMVLE